MTRLQSRNLRVLAIAPSTRGFGFAVLEGEETLVDWGATEVKHDKNAETLAKVERLVVHYQSDVLVLPDAFNKNSRRSPRIKSLCQEIATLAETRKIKVKTISNEQVRKSLLGTAEATKHAIAEMLAKRFQAELGSSVPPKRRPWTSEDRRMDIFDAVGLALTFRSRG
jgi:Holliday junction resolvasome RuvABC endonuclease subunit